jgi:hypothetical protein
MGTLSEEKNFRWAVPLIILGFIIKYYEIRLLKFGYSKFGVIQIKNAEERIQKK